MAADCDAGLALERGKIGLAEKTGNRYQLTAARAVQMVMMPIHQLETGPSVFERHFADQPVADKLFRRPENRREIRSNTGARQSRAQLVDGPGVTIRTVEKAKDRRRDDGLARHSQKATCPGILMQTICVIARRP